MYIKHIIGISLISILAVVCFGCTKSLTLNYLGIAIMPRQKQLKQISKNSTKNILAQIAPNTLGIDYCDPIKPKTIKANGYGFVCRYINPTQPDFNTQLSPKEYKNLTNAGLSVMLIWEINATRALEGRQAGIDDASYAKQFCDKLKLTQPIYFTVDTDARGAALNKVSAYFEGIKTILPFNQIGVYGSITVVKHCLDNKLASSAWQTFAWSGGRNDKQEDAGTKWDPRANIQQTRIDSDSLNHVGIDINRFVR